MAGNEISRPGAAGESWLSISYHGAESGRKVGLWSGTRGKGLVRARGQDDSSQVGQRGGWAPAVPLAGRPCCPPARPRGGCDLIVSLLRSPGRVPAPGGQPQAQGPEAFKTSCRWFAFSSHPPAKGTSPGLPQGPEPRAPGRHPDGGWHLWLGARHPFPPGDGVSAPSRPFCRPLRR